MRWVVHLVARISYQFVNCYLHFQQVINQFDTLDSHFFCTCMYAYVHMHVEAQD